MQDYYQILGIARTSDSQTIKKAYRMLARQYHPDQNPHDPQAEEKFKAINEAYETLGNEQKRSQYDRFRYYQKTSYSWQYRSSSPSTESDTFRFSDLFENWFGRNRSQQRAQYNLQQAVDISLEEAYRGTVRKFSLRDDLFTARIPAGADTGTKIRIRQKGKLRPDGRRGDLYLLVNVKPHALFTRDGDDLGVTIEVDLVTAVLGGRVSLETTLLNTAIEVPAGTQPEQQLIVRGAGMPNLYHQGKRGDLYAHVKIIIPTELTEAERSLFAQLAQLRKPIS